MENGCTSKPRVINSDTAEKTSASVNEKLTSNENDGFTNVNNKRKNQGKKNTNSGTRQNVKVGGIPVSVLHYSIPRKYLAKPRSFMGSCELEITVVILVRDRCPRGKALHTQASSAELNVTDEKKMIRRHPGSDIRPYTKKIKVTSSVYTHELSAQERHFACIRERRLVRNSLSTEQEIQFWER
ncbi:hypothetical protein Tco_1094244 [Tanacetum coccineum]|uniref:Uncharacterized protein n=1 Tax=Tanacetum coccineum TaxID=301880 RepID=A0ABQ5IG83_9ASTR